MQPNLQPEGFSTPANCAACRSSIRQGSQSFYLASQLLPASVREPAYAVYAFCRMADDLIDRHDGGIDAIGDLGRMLDRIYSGQPDADFVERGFADVVSRFAIPRAIPDALIEGLAWDASGRRYETLDELTAYAVRVAGTVGFMMTLVMGPREPGVLARACDLGVAMQLTNIARDIGEDASNGRIYMPLAWLRDGGVDPNRWLDSPEYSAAIRSTVARLLSEAERLYERSLCGIGALPSHSRVGINTARVLYREIGRRITSGLDPVAERAVTTRGQKLRLLAQAWVSPVSGSIGLDEPPVPAAQFLIDAVSALPATSSMRTVPRWWDVKARSEHMIHLLANFSARNSLFETRPAQRAQRSSNLARGT